LRLVKGLGGAKNQNWALVSLIAGINLAMDEPGAKKGILKRRDLK